MTKAEFIEKVLGMDGVPELSKKEATGLVEAVFGAVSKAISDEGRFSYPGFGTFAVKKRAERKGRNPRTGEEITIAESSTVSFKPAPAFKDTL